MVTISEIRAANTSLRSSRSGLTAVVAGATNGRSSNDSALVSKSCPIDLGPNTNKFVVLGIGFGFAKALVSQTDSVKLYIIGRGDRLFSVISELQALNSNATYIPIQVSDLTLLADIETATSQIVEQESKVDLLFMSQGFLSLGSRDESKEGIDKIGSIRHYGRTLMILNLLPLLNAAPSPRVVSVLAGSKEGPIFRDDLEFKDPKNYSVSKIAEASASYVSLTHEQLQKQNPKISFVHAFPGFVKTSLFRTENFGRVLGFLINWIIIPITSRFLWQTIEESGERFL